MLDLKMDDQLVNKSLERYNLHGAAAEFLGKSDNISYKVIAGEHRFLLKFHSQTRSVATVRSEMQWLQDLGRDTDLEVSTPYSNLDGDFVTTMEANGENLICTMQSWVEGELLQRDPNVAEVDGIAHALAALHRHSQQWTLPEGFTRPSYEPQQLNEWLQDMGSLFNKGLVPQNLFSIYEETIVQIQQELMPLTKSNETWGLIHSDLHESNYVLHDGEVRPIDFSACGFGYYLFDLAETCLHLDRDNRRRLIETYGKELSLPSGHERLLESLFLWAVIRGFAFHSVNPAEHASLAKSIPAVAKSYCISYLSGKRFLLSSG